MSDTKKTAAAAEAASLQEDMDAVMRKYDRESATRIWAGKIGRASCRERV